MSSLPMTKNEENKPSAIVVALDTKPTASFAAANIPYDAKTAKLISISPLGASGAITTNISASYVNKGGCYFELTSLGSTDLTNVKNMTCLATISLTY